MRVIPFPSRQDPEVDPAVLAELEAAFDGDGTGPEAEAWRELRADVRSLAAPIDPGFQESLEQQLRRDTTERRAPRFTNPLRGGWLRHPALAVCTVLVLVVAFAFVGAKLTSGGSKIPVVSTGGPRSAPTHPEAQSFAGSAQEESSRHGPEAAGPELPGTVETPASFGALKAPGETPKRLQQLSAAITLGGGSAGVQAVAGRVGQAAVAAGGYVESSKVELQRGAGGEASLALRVPSAKLAATLAALQRMAPVRAETQELQDLTGHYDAVAGRLAAARAEREALLRALSRAESTTAIESLHQRIAHLDSAITADERAEAAISHTASEAQIEVTVLGETAHSGGGLTIGRGFDDAGHVLTVVAAVLLIASAVLVPLALLAAALLWSARGWRRHQRERALGPS